MRIEVGGRNVLRYHFYVNQTEEGKVEHSMEGHNKTCWWGGGGGVKILREYFLSPDYKKRI